MTLHADIEFDCAECGRHILQLCGPSMAPLCSLCTMLPGWFQDPEAAKLLDPEHCRNPPAHEIV